MDVGQETTRSVAAFNCIPLRPVELELSPSFHTTCRRPHPQQPLRQIRSPDTLDLGPPRPDPQVLFTNKLPCICFVDTGHRRISHSRGGWTLIKRAISFWDTKRSARKRLRLQASSFKGCAQGLKRTGRLIVHDGVATKPWRAPVGDWRTR